VVLLACGQVEPAERRGHLAHDRSLTDGQLGRRSPRFRPSLGRRRQPGMNVPLSLRPRRRVRVEAGARHPRQASCPQRTRTRRPLARSRPPPRSCIRRKQQPRSRNRVHVSGSLAWRRPLRARRPTRLRASPASCPGACVVGSHAERGWRRAAPHGVWRRRRSHGCRRSACRSESPRIRPRAAARRARRSRLTYPRRPAFEQHRGGSASP
jgi:hypothetical protein